MRGDLVHTTDPVTGQSSSRPVLATITGSGTKHLIAVTTTGTAFTATTGHPIWVEATGWTTAEDLQVGDQLTASTGAVHTITSVEDLGQLPDQDVYNLTVSSTHTYYIASKHGLADTLVHNATLESCDPTRGPLRYTNNRRASRTYGDSVSEVRGLARNWVRGMKKEGFSASIPPVRYDRFGEGIADITVKAVRGSQSHIRHFITKHAVR